MSAEAIVELELDYEPATEPAHLAWLSESPFGAMLELVLHAAQQARPGSSLSDLSFLEPLRFDGPRRCRVLVERAGGAVRVSSTAPHEPVAIAHMIATLDEPQAARSHAPRRTPPGAALDASLRALVEPRALALLDAVSAGTGVGVFERIVASEGGWRAVLVDDAPFDPQYAVHPAILEQVWHLASGFWASRGLAGARPLLARSLRVLERGTRVRSIELVEHQAMALRIELRAGSGVVCVLEDVRSDAAVATSTEVPAIELLAQRELRAGLRARSGPARAAWLESTLAELLAEILRRPLDELARDASFRDLGLKSMDAIRLSVALCHALELAPYSTLLFDHPSIAQLAAHLVSLEPVGHGFERPAAQRVAPSRAPARRAPIAIVGIGCRIPGGASDPESYWRLLREGRCAVGPIGQSRQALLPSFRDFPWAVSHLDDIELFDARFFDMGEAEALATTPFQRVLLETAWHAFEHAGIVPSTLRGSATSVYVAGALPEYAELLPSRDAYFATGNSPSVLAGRLSYTFDLRGASVVVDTVCSSSAVALCLACDDLRAGTSELALVGGINLMLDPRVFDGLIAASVLSEQGRCAAFDESADGYVRGEACCVMALRTLDEAQRRGERVIAVVREYGVGHGGHSPGMAAPSAQAQIGLIRDVLQRAAVEAKDIGYVEAHGTGTRVGDAIELQVLASTYGAGSKRKTPVRVGSVKTNIGHAEPAAGLVGIAKAALALNQRAMPMHLHFETPNAGFDWANGGLAVQTVTEPWPSDAPAMAAVNSFGISGTYAHVIVEAPPAQASMHNAAHVEAACLLPLTARSKASLRTLAASYAAHLRAGASLHALAKGAILRRESLPLRAAVVGRSSATVIRKLEALARDDAAAVANPRKLEIAFMYPGQGIQALGVGGELYETQPAFRAAFDRCAQIAEGLAGLRLIDLIQAAPSDAPLPTDLAQPLIFAFEMALTRLLQHWGVSPTYVMGHSLGEYTAACVAGVFDTETGMRLVVERGRLMRALASPGAMVVVEAREDALAQLMASLSEPLEVASINGQESFTLSGTPLAVAQCLQLAAARDLRAQRLPVDQAFHSRLMDPVVAPFERFVAGLSLRRAQGMLIANGTGMLAGAELAEPGHWSAHLRRPVQLMKSIRTLVELGANAFVEVGPRSTLLAAATRCTDAPCHWVPTLRAGSAEGRENEQVLETCAKLYALGASVSLGVVLESLPAVREALYEDIPLYAFDRKRYWPSAGATAGHARGQRTPAIEYQLSWVPQPLAQVAMAAGASETWIVAGKHGSIRDALASALARDRGRTVQRLPLEAAERLPILEGVRRVICVLEPDEALDDVEAVVRGVALAASWVRLLERASPRSQIVFVTLGAQQVVGEARQPYASALASFARTAAFEHPDVFHALHDLPAKPTQRDLHALVAAVAADDGETQCAIRHGQRFGARIVAAADTPERAGFAVRPDAVYCITGGFGHIGMHVARWLVEQGARKVCLIARGGADGESRASVVQALAALGASVSVLALDTGDHAALRAALASIERPIAAIFHAAGVPGDCTIRDLDEMATRRVLQGKAAGGQVICELAHELGVEHTVLFSSLASVLSGVGQAAYAAANGYLDALACSARVQGLRVQSILWGPWAGGGMGDVVGSGAWLAGGLTPVQPRVALAVLSRLLAAGSDQHIVVDVDWAALRSVVERGRPWPIFGDASLGTSGTARGSELVRTLLQLTADERVSTLRSFLSAEIGSLLGDREVWHEPDADLFEEVGLDSLAFVQLRGRIRAALGVLVDPPLFLEHRSVSTLAAALEALLQRKAET